MAARIGQGLLHRNKALEDRLTAVEGELTSAHDTVTQLKHDLALKAELLQIYTNDFDDSSPEGGTWHFNFIDYVLKKKVHLRHLLATFFMIKYCGLKTNQIYLITGLIDFAICWLLFKVDS